MITSFRLRGYALLAAMYSLREPDTPAETIAPDDSIDGSVVFYCATIGELQAVHPLITYINTAHPGTRIVILAGQPQYVDSFRTQVPDALIGVVPGPALGDMTRFFESVRPRLVILSEGPSLYARFPIRLGLGLSAACLKYRVPMIVTNACLYELSLGSRIDKLEYILFRDLHTQAIQRWYVSFVEQLESLVAAGVPKQRITIAGDLKFDNLSAIRDRRPTAELDPLLGRYRDSVTIVGASLNNREEEEALLSAWQEFRKQDPKALLVLAPRYVNRLSVINRMYGLLDRAGVKYAKRSDGIAAAMDSDVLVLDVFGELTHYFAVADMCFMGRDHGVLEPLAFAKPMVAANRDSWQDFNTSYPLYRLMIEGEGLVELKNLDELGEILIRLHRDTAFRSGFVDRAAAIIAAHRGATKALQSDISTYLESKFEEVPG